MIVHSKCKSNVAQFCGTRQIAVEMYEEWKKQVKKTFNKMNYLFIFQNKSNSIETYTSPEECTTIEKEEKNRQLLINIYERLQHVCEHNDAIEDLNLITKSYEYSEELNQK